MRLFSRQALSCYLLALQALADAEQHIHTVNLTDFSCPQSLCLAARSPILPYRQDSYISATPAHVVPDARQHALVAAKPLRAAPVTPART